MTNQHNRKQHLSYLQLKNIKEKQYEIVPDQKTPQNKKGYNLRPVMSKQFEREGKVCEYKKINGKKGVIPSRLRCRELKTSPQETTHFLGQYTQQKDIHSNREKKRQTQSYKDLSLADSGRQGKGQIYRGKILGGGPSIRGKIFIKMNIKLVSFLSKLIQKFYLFIKFNINNIQQYINITTSNNITQYMYDIQLLFIIFLSNLIQYLCFNIKINIKFVFLLKLIQHLCFFIKINIKFVFFIKINIKLVFIIKINIKFLFIYQVQYQQHIIIHKYTIQQQYNIIYV
eukprot:TRINITY_DN1255_c2_g1_i1.p1 TRINITY_DN1255_c2_g1~~TRINITY_DN1255_c2_g1_i1.p1  ORF type:complete len:285 (-),score=-14.23 TRINITY_DN1255_c2_g1_i1:117-971(-)